MQIEFNEKDHIYIINGEIAQLSVTKLLAKHNLANDYGGIDKKVLNRKANYGTTIHKDIEDYITKGKAPETQEGKLFKEWAINNLSCAIAEQLLGIDYNGLTIGGSADLLGFLKNGNAIILDHKTYATMDNKTKLHIAWQLSLYDYMARHIDNVNGVKLNWFGAKVFRVLWYRKDIETKEITLEIIDVDKIEDVEIENLLNSEIKGIKYIPQELIIAKDLEMKLQQAEMALAKKELEIKAYEEEAEKYREQIKEMMEKQRILNWKSPNGLISISYVSAYTKGQIDSKKLQKERPDIYNSYLKTSNVKATIKVNVDEEKLEELKNGTIHSMELETTSVGNE